MATTVWGNPVGGCHNGGGTSAIAVVRRQQRGPPLPRGQIHAPVYPDFAINLLYRRLAVTSEGGFGSLRPWHPGWLFAPPDSRA